MTSENGQKEEITVFRARLKSARELRGMSQGELAEKAKLPPSSVSHFEGGKRKPSFDNLRKLAGALNVTTDYLLGRTERTEVPREADVLFRNVNKLTEKDRALAEDFIKMLAERKG